MIYVHRYLRLFFVLGFMILFIMFMFQHVGTNGPQSDFYFNVIGENCRKYWWATLLMINNLVPTSTQDNCAGWTWYLANDWEFFLICPIVLALYVRN